ncbi:MAG: hypothetical protein PHQ74_08630 [Crocinitomicaceae bacterium]|nr:hypothetical protein [Crocinitomicaceae bacterium]
MKNTILLLTFALFSITSTFAQKDKISIDKNIVTVNGVAVFELDVTDNGNSIKLSNLDGKELAFFKGLDFYDSQEITSGNPKGRVIYYETTFMNDQRQCELSIPGMRKAFVKFILENKLVVDGEINVAAEDRLILINGKKFSERRKNSTTIIIVR